MARTWEICYSKTSFLIIIKSCRIEFDVVKRNTYITLNAFKEIAIKNRNNKLFIKIDSIIITINIILKYDFKLKRKESC